MNLYVNIYKHFIHLMIIFVNTIPQVCFWEHAWLKKFRKADKEARRFSRRSGPRLPNLVNQISLFPRVGFCYQSPDVVATLYLA
jgi:hypothetical protein